MVNQNQNEAENSIILKKYNTTPIDYNKLLPEVHGEIVLREVFP